MNNTGLIDRLLTIHNLFFSILSTWYGIKVWSIACWPSTICFFYSVHLVWNQSWMRVSSNSGVPKLLICRPILLKERLSQVVSPDQSLLRTGACLQSQVFSLSFAYHRKYSLLPAWNSCKLFWPFFAQSLAKDVVVWNSTSHRRHRNQYPFWFWKLSALNW